MRIRTFSLAAVSFTLLGGVFACAATEPSQQLLDARRTYDRARSSAAARYAPDKLLDAKQALAKAERVHDEDSGSLEEQHFAYVAERKAQLAMAHGQLAKSNRVIENSNRAYATTQDEIRQTAMRQLAETRGALQATQRELNQVQTSMSAQGGEVEDLRAQQNALEQRRQQLEAQRENLEQALASERAARQQAEARAQSALKSLEEIASVKEEAGETVITLTGEVLFKTAEADLNPIAKERLNAVAEALKEQDVNKEIIVEGHTDSRGSDSMNQGLSERRASSVRRYLISQGVDENRIRAVGRGEDDPIAQNNTPEGRANNRRVEIHIRDRR